MRRPRACAARVEAADYEIAGVGLRASSACARPDTHTHTLGSVHSYALRVH